MERTLYTVEPTEPGWQVSVSGKPLEHFRLKVAALCAAETFARIRYHATGEPTGVHMRMLCGDRVMVGKHG
ncbi:hypothetical protein M2650_04235 [Luteimonas sp. SX5]|uniref:DUF2188 domain-containing protein n=1 Tax=Luteimonas galliterrae TaxID=2940486 RepID=A0ABT0MG55_9GAMM|nr:hypothetical protein [Luteimonas galliterrae]MCL1633852.1 hypothetical protein [Luteimonas galliterrae]